MLSYREANDGQVLEEGITEAGSMASFQAAGTAYATHGLAMVPFYIFYSMFGFQRTGDQIWAFGDARGRGFLLGATAGRTTLTGEGLQHDDGHSHVLASTVPNILAYDPAYAYELATIVRSGIERMYVDGRGRLLLHHALQRELRPADDARRRRRGDRQGPLPAPRRHRTWARRPSPARLVGSGSILQQVLAAQELLAEKLGVAAEVYSAPSFQQLRSRRPRRSSAGTGCTRTQEPRVPYVAQVLGPDGGPIVAATDWMRALPDMVARWLPSSFVPLGTDGFGRSDTREALRSFFEIDPPQIAAATLAALARCGGYAGRARPPRRSASSASTPRRPTPASSDRRRPCHGPGVGALAQAAGRQRSLRSEHPGAEEQHAGDRGEGPDLPDLPSSCRAAAGPGSAGCRG